MLLIRIQQNILQVAIYFSVWQIGNALGSKFEWLVWVLGNDPLYPHLNLIVKQGINMKGYSLDENI